MSRSFRRHLALGAVLAGLVTGGAPASASVLPSGFRDVTVFQGLNQPINFAFAPDGRVFVAEKRGVIKVFDSFSDTTPDVVADLRTEVNNYWDRGLLGMALDPQYPARPYLYILYTYDAAIGGSAPRWGSPDSDDDSCPDPPGGNDQGCVVSGRLSRLTLSGNQAVGEQVLLNDWCQQYPSHSIGDIQFGPDGKLYASGGDGASFKATPDYGQFGWPQVNPCGDAPGGVGGSMTPPGAQGGSLRSQDVRTLGDPTDLNGSIIRVDPDTAAPLSGNPFFSTPGADDNAKRIVAYGFRNPFRFTFRPGTSEIFAGEVGWDRADEIDRIQNPTGAAAPNFGWPCFEGNERQSAWEQLHLSLCDSLYAAGTDTKPYFAQYSNSRVVPGDGCAGGGNSISGVAFAPGSGGPYPSSYDGALFWSDYTRQCIYTMRRGANGLPDPNNLSRFAGQVFPVKLVIGPGGDLWWADIVDGQIHRARYTAGNQSPTAVIQADRTTGSPGTTINFDGRGSTDPDAADVLTYSWDLDGDGTFGDSTSATPSHTYAAAGTYTVRLRVTDQVGASDTTSRQIQIGNTPPTAKIDTPAATLRWLVGDQVSFSGSAVDAETANLPDSAFTWQLNLRHCSSIDPNQCHTHFVQTFTGTRSGTFTAPDHEYPSHLELQLTVTDPGGLSDTKTIELYPADPSAPTGLSATRIANGVALAWNPNREISLDGYMVYRSGGGQTDQLLSFQAQPGYIDATAQRGVSYTYTVRPSYSYGVLGPPASVSSPAVPLDPAGAASTTSVGSNSVALSWGASPDPLAYGYLVFRDGGGQSGRLVSWQGPSTTFTDSTVAPETTYTYTVKAWDLLGRQSVANAPLTVTTPKTPLAPPSSPTAASLGPGAVRVVWTASPDPIAFGYLVFRDGGGQTGRLVSWQGPSTTFTDSTVASRTSYSYYVRAWDLIGRNSTAAGPAAVTTP
ncbi:MAG: PQQ-dependent sugar dehydrogenase [Solirubrobacteraceae bacterium]